MVHVSHAFQAKKKVSGLNRSKSNVKHFFSGYKLLSFGVKHNIASKSSDHPNTYFCTFVFPLFSSRCQLKLTVWCASGRWCLMVMACATIPWIPTLTLQCPRSTAARTQTLPVWLRVWRTLCWTWRPCWSRHPEPSFKDRHNRQFSLQQHLRGQAFYEESFTFQQSGSVAWTAFFDKLWH